MTNLRVAGPRRDGFGACMYGRMLGWTWADVARRRGGVAEYGMVKGAASDEGRTGFVLCSVRGMRDGCGWRGDEDWWVRLRDDLGRESVQLTKSRCVGTVLCQWQGLQGHRRCRAIAEGH